MKLGSKIGWQYSQLNKHSNNGKLTMCKSIINLQQIFATTLITTNKFIHGFRGYHIILHERKKMLF